MADIILTFRQKKNAARKILYKKGFLKKGGLNTFDDYKYFSEAQYKELFVELFSETGLEFYCTIDSVEDIQGSIKQPYAKRVGLLCTLQDMDSDVAETSKWFGEAFDRSDKALYKAYTGALKYYFANTWHVPTGDDPEADKRQPDAKEAAEEVPEFIQQWQIDTFNKALTPDALTTMLSRKNLIKIEDMSYEDASTTLAQLREMAKKRNKAAADGTTPQ